MMSRERLVVAGLFGIPMFAAVAMVAWTSDRPASAQTTVSASRLDPLVGLVQPSDVVDLASSEKGVIEEITIEDGDMVTKGQIICRLESSVELASLKISGLQAESDEDIKAAEAAHELAETEFKRLERLSEKDAAGFMELETARINDRYTARKLEKAQHDKRVVEFQYIRDQKVIDRRTIRSPLDGYVAKKVKSVGELVDGVDDTVVCQIVKLDPLHVVVPTPVAAYGKISEGDRAVLQADQLPGGWADAEVILVNKLIQADSQTYSIKLALPNPGSKIPAGIKVTVTFP